MTEKKLETDVFPFASKGFDSAQAKLLRNMFDRHRVYVDSDGISSTGAVSSIRWAGRSGRDYLVTVTARASLLATGGVNLSFDPTASTDLTALGIAYVVLVDGSATRGGFGISVPNLTAAFDDDDLNAGNGSNPILHWKTLISCPSNQIIQLYADCTGGTFSRIFCEVHELS